MIISREINLTNRLYKYEAGQIMFERTSGDWNNRNRIINLKDNDRILVHPGCIVWFNRNYPWGTSKLHMHGVLQNLYNGFSNNSDNRPIHTESYVFKVIETYYSSDFALHMGLAEFLHKTILNGKAKEEKIQA